MPASRFGRIAAGSSGWDAEQHAVGWDHPMTDRDANDQPQPGMDIGRERGYEATEPSEDIKSRYYGSDGSTLDYVYELDGDTLTIWFGGKGSPAYYKGSFSDDGDTLTGAWVTPAVAATPPPRPGRAAPRTSSGSTSTAGERDAGGGAAACRRSAPSCPCW